MQISVVDHHALETLFDELQGTARARVVTPDDVARIAREAEAELEAIGVSTADRKGCEYAYLPVGYTTRKYASKAPMAAATWIKLRREADGWYLVAAERSPRRMTTLEVPAGQLWITPDVHDDLVRMYARRFWVLY